MPHNNSDSILNEEERGIVIRAIEQVKAHGFGTIIFKIENHRLTNLEKTEKRKLI
jgi:hypothetical protein